MGHFTQQASWYAQRLGVGILIAATTGSAVTVLSELVALHQDKSSWFTVLIAACLGAVFGGVLGGLPAFLVLVTLLKHVTPRKAFLPLTVGASFGLALDFFITSRYLPEGYSGAQSFTALALSCAGATLGGLVASVLLRKRYSRMHRDLETADA